MGAGLRVYCYDRAIDPPPGIGVADARLICPDRSLLSRYLVAGKPSLATFADFFRYRMIQETGCCWVDTDIICLRKPDFAGDPIVFGRQSEAYGRSLINNAVLKLPPAHPLLEELIRRAESAVDTDQPWGAIGLFLLSDLAEEYGVDRYARDFHDSTRSSPIVLEAVARLLPRGGRGRNEASDLSAPLGRAVRKVRLRQVRAPGRVVSF